MAILVRRTNGRRKFEGLTYLHRPTRGKKALVYKGKRYRKVFESLDTDTAYKRALRERKKRPAVWTGERVREGRTYGVFVRRYVRRRQEMRVLPAGPDFIHGTQEIHIDNIPVAQYRVESRPDHPQEAIIEWVGIRADYRGKGVGRQVVQQILEDLRTRGFRRVILASLRDSTGFWQKMGFRVTHRGTYLDQMERELGSTEPLNSARAW
jgi:ribosomal protein S18 acetylase RimI-like enzyme